MKFHSIILKRIVELSRAILDRLLDVVARSSLRGRLVQPALWDRAIAFSHEAIKDLGQPTLLYGDPYAYNIIVTLDKQCWLDFERLAVGLPELDNARAWVLIHGQAQREVSTHWKSKAQLACHFLAAISFCSLISLW